MTLPRIAALILLAQTLAAPRQSPQNTTVEGVVVSAGSGAPMAAMHVRLSVATGPPRLSAPMVGTTIDTDAQGRFAFSGLAPGFYILNVMAENYAIQASGQQRVLPGEGMLMNLMDGQLRRGLEIRLAPAGIVTGRVTNTDGRPLAQSAVELRQPVYDAFGRRGYDDPIAAMTNDRGEYRLTSIPPGHYYLVAETPWAPNTKPADAYGAMLYPGTIDPNAATPIDVVAGAPMVLKDLALERLRLYAIRGRVIDQTTGQPPPQAFVWITTMSDALIGPETIIESPSYNATDGTFLVRSVGPGVYRLGVTIPNLPINAIAARAPLAPEAREVSMTISNADVSGVTFTVMPAVTLPARLSVEGQALTSLAGWDAIRVRLRSSRNGVIYGLREPFPQFSPANPDGTVRIGNVMPGEFRLRVEGLPAGTYVKSARLGSVDVLDQPLQFFGSTPDTLEIALSPRAGRVDGVVLNDQGRPSAGAQAVLVPEQHRDRTDLFQAATTDQGGRFAFDGVSPGDYRVFAWEGLRPFSYFDPDVLRRAGQDRPTTLVHVTESSSRRVDVKVVVVK